MEIRFLSVDDVLALHQQVIQLYGGAHGLRDRNVLESAVIAPQQTFQGDYLYESVAHMCAALWHGLVQNHAFIDGNKRVGLRAADVFLALNGFDLTISAKEAVEWTLSIATGQLDRRELSQLVERRLRRL